MHAPMAIAYCWHIVLWQSPATIMRGALSAMHNEVDWQQQQCGVVADQQQL
jgi:hypothetical protein